jgi:hypothetical protein
MKNKGVAIQYGAVAPEAKENFYPSASEKKFDTLSQLQRYNLNFPNYANPCELYQTVLDGTAVAFPSAPNDANLGLVSEQISGEDGAFENPIVLTMTSNGQYSSMGITFTFDKWNDIYPKRVSVQWYRVLDGVESLLSEKEYAPDSAFYFCQNNIEGYNKLVITFYDLNMPKNRLRLVSIDYGYGTIFYGNELRGVKIIQSLDPISSEISINTADFTIDSKSDVEYSFQAKQPLSIYFNGSLKATTFVKKSTRKAKNLWSIQSEDYIGIMDSVPFQGGIYVDAMAVDVLAEIFSIAKVPYKIDEVFNESKISGYIPYTSCRKALMQVAFAIQAVIDTSESDVVNVFALDEEVKQNVPLKRIMQGQNFSDDDAVTAVEVTSHSYKAISEIVDAYDASESGTGESIFVKFNEPLHDLSISNGEILLSGTNYAVINASDGCILRGQKYEHTTKTKRKTNPLVLASDIEKVVSITDATLVSKDNIDKVLQKCYNWFERTNQTNLKIVEGKHIIYGKVATYGSVLYGEFPYGYKSPDEVLYDEPVSVGKKINAETEYLGVVSGILIKQSYNLDGNIIVKEAVLK